MKVTLAFIAGAIVGRRVLVTIDSKVRVTDRIRKRVGDKLANIAYDFADRMAGGGREKENG